MGLNDIKNNSRQMIQPEGDHYTEWKRALGLPQESLLSVIWRQRWILLTCMLAAMILATIYLFRANPIYVSVSRLYVEQTGPKIMSELEDGVMTRSKNYLFTQAELLRATPILSAALERCQSQQMSTFHNIDNPIGYLKETLETSVGKKDDILQVVMKSPYPLEAAQIVNAVVDAYVTFHTSRKRSTSLEILKILQKEQTTRSKELAEQLQAMVAFKQEHESVVFQSGSENVLFNNLDRISLTLSDAKLTALDLRVLYETSKAMVADANGLQRFVQNQRNQQAVNNNGEWERLILHLDELRQLRMNISKQLRQNHPALLTLDQEIAGLNETLKQYDQHFAECQLAVMEQQLRTAQTRVEELMQDYSQCRRDVVEFNRQLDQYVLLQSNYEQTKHSCDLLDERIKELNITEDAGALNITILEVAHPADIPSFPVRSKVLAMALIFGLITGGTGAFARDLMNHRINDVDEVSRLISAPVLGIVPSMSHRLSLRERSQSGLHAPNSEAAEAFRTLRTAIVFSVPQEEARVIHVTSAFASGGKSTLVSNLGIAIAQAGQRVLILDGDLRKPVQHDIFQVQREVGLTTVLAGLGPLREAIVSCGIQNLDLLPSGPGVPNPAELLSSNRLKQVLNKLRTRYDRILVDSPPVVPVADGSILAAVSNTTILVVRLGTARQKALLHAEEIVTRVGGHIMGCVINDASAKGMPYGGYGYGYGNNHKKNKSGGNGDGDLDREVKDSIRFDLAVASKEKMYQRG